MVTDPILNSKEIKNVFELKEKAYDYFYMLHDQKGKVMNNLKDIYNKNISIEEKIKSGYQYINEYFEKNK